MGFSVLQNISRESPSFIEKLLKSVSDLTGYFVYTPKNFSKREKYWCNLKILKYLVSNNNLIVHELQ